MSLPVSDFNAYAFHQTILVTTALAYNQHFCKQQIQVELLILTINLTIIYYRIFTIKIIFRD